LSALSIGSLVFPPVGTSIKVGAVRKTEYAAILKTELVER